MSDALGETERVNATSRPSGDTSGWVSPKDLRGR